jgi:hypothetical protein
MRWTVLAALLAGGAFAFYGAKAHRRTVERTRFGEARELLGQIQEAQKRAKSSSGEYVYYESDFERLDLGMTRRPPAFGMKNFILSSSHGIGCEGGYRLLFHRCDHGQPAGCDALASTPDSRYGSYTMVYDSCADDMAFPECETCEEDLDD